MQCLRPRQPVGRRKARWSWRREARLGEASKWPASTAMNALRAACACGAPLDVLEVLLARGADPTALCPPLPTLLRDTTSVEPPQPPPSNSLGRPYNSVV